MKRSDITKLTLSFVFGSLVLLVVACKQDAPAPVMSPPSATGQYISVYADGLQHLYEAAATKAEEGKFNDLADAMEFVSGNTEEIKERAFDPMREQLEEINGDKWSNEKAAQTFRDFAEGFKIK